MSRHERFTEPTAGKKQPSASRKSWSQDELEILTRAVRRDKNPHSVWQKHFRGIRSMCAMKSKYTQIKKNLVGAKAIQPGFLESTSISGQRRVLPNIAPGAPPEGSSDESCASENEIVENQSEQATKRRRLSQENIAPNTNTAVVTAFVPKLHQTYEPTVSK